MAVTDRPDTAAAHAVGDQLGRKQAEQRALADLVVRLRHSFPDVPEQEIEATVHSGYTSFDGSRVRDFIIVLVERRAREQLRGSRAS